MHDSDNEERIKGIGLALVVATLLALAAIVLAETFSFALFGPDEATEKLVHEASERHAHIFAAMAKCLSEPTVITVAGIPAADCKPRKSK